MQHKVFWKNPGYKPRPALKKDISCDYLIVGGGIAGVSTAYFLSKQGAKNIVLVEKNFVGSGATGKSAGTLVLRGETDLILLFKTHGRKEAVLYWKGVHKALKDLKTIIVKEKIECDAEPQDTLYCGGKNSHFLFKEYALEKKLEKTTKLVRDQEFKKELNTELFTHGFLSSLHGLSVNPLKLVQNFSKVIESRGVKIYENTTFLKKSGNIAITDKAKIKFKKIILAVDADTPANQVKTQKTTIVVTKPLNESQLKKTGLDKRKIVWDSKDNYNYFKVTKEKRLLFGFGITIVNKRHRKTEPHPPHLNNIKIFMKKLFPYLNLEPDYAWAGTFGVTKNYEPLFKFHNKTASISGAGSQIICFMAAQYITNKLLGKKSPWDKFFNN